MELSATSKVLVVDDDPTVVLQNQLILRRVYNIPVDDILVANDGEEALEIVAENPDIDLIICDMDMPAMDGLTFFQQMRAQSDTDIPYIMSTGGNAERQQEIEGIFAQNGGNALFTEKPFNITKLGASLIKLQPRSGGGFQPGAEF